MFSELRKKGLGSWKLWFWRDKYGLEVDFLNHVGGHFELTEAKWSQQPTLRDGSNLEKVAAILGADQINLARIICRAQGRYVLSSQNTDIVVEGWGESS